MARAFAPLDHRVFVVDGNWDDGYSRRGDLDRLWRSDLPFALW